MADVLTSADGTVTFLPHRLNRHPTVVRGLTANELWVCSGAFALLGAAVGTPLAIAFGTVAIVPTVILLSVAVGVFGGGSVLRRMKRGRPETWLYRQLQWRLVCRFPWTAPYVGGRGLVTRSGRWTTRRRVTR